MRLNKIIQKDYTSFSLHYQIKLPLDLEIVFKAVLEKSALASQPTVSRFFNRMDEDTLKQFQEISRILKKRIYIIQMPQAVILDLTGRQGI